MREAVVPSLRTGPAFVSNSPEATSRDSEPVIALRAEFVLKPGHEEEARETIDVALASSFARDRQFLQALVLVSEMESRLVTVITFWHGSGFAEARGRRVVQLRQKLQPYLDQSLRVQAFSAHVMEAKNTPSARQAALTEDPFSPSAKTCQAAVV